MQAENTIVENHSLSSPFATLRAGDCVLVYDGAKEKNLWCEIADIKEVNGRWKIRVTGTDFYFDEALVINFIKGRETNNPAAFPISVFTTANGSIAIFNVVSNCQQCGNPSGQLFNVGTSLERFHICYVCRFPESEVA
jgi:hypothetical protein